MLISMSVLAGGLYAISAHRCGTGLRMSVVGAIVIAIVWPVLAFFAFCILLHEETEA
jgi:hypothetical protein